MAAEGSKASAPLGSQASFFQQIVGGGAALVQMRSDLSEDVQVGHGRSVQCPGNRLVGQIVVGGAESAGDDDEIGPGDCLQHCFTDLRRLVADGVDRVDGVPRFEQLAGRITTGGVKDSAGRQFVADGNDFTDHVMLSQRWAVAPSFDNVVNSTVATVLISASSPARWMAI